MDEFEWIRSGDRTAGNTRDRERGWYVDPSEPRRHRYWDGSQWHPQPPTQRDGTGAQMDIRLPRARPRSD
jgi:uncharacterized protein DUF2510